MSELDLRASDAEREQAVVRLREACAEGRLTLDEFAQRVDEAYAARTHEELARVTRELPAQATPRRKRRRRFTIAIFGGSDLRGRFRVPRRSFMLNLFGGSDIDLRQAELDAPVATYFALNLFGGGDIYVPEGIEVDLISFALFGGNDECGSEGEVHPGSPLIRVVALSLFGGMDVWHVPAGREGSLRELRRAVRLELKA